MPHPRLQRLPIRTQNKIFSPFSVRRLHLRLGPKHKHRPLNLNLSLFRRSVMGHPVSHLPRIGTSATTGATPLYLCNRMCGVLLCLPNSHLCLVPEVIYGADPPGPQQVRVLASSIHQHLQATLKLRRRMCLGTSGAVSSRWHLELLHFVVDMPRSWQSDPRIALHQARFVTYGGLTTGHNAIFSKHQREVGFCLSTIHTRSHPIYSSQFVSSLITTYAGIRSFQSCQKLVFEETFISHEPSRSTFLQSDEILLSTPQKTLSRAEH